MRDSELQRLRLDEVDRTPLYLLAYRRLRELIASGAFAPGEKLMSEAKLAEAMGVGRTSLRTALVLLQEDGYVSTRHGSGTFVTQRLPSPEDAAPAACLTVRERLERLHLPLQVQPGPVRLGQRDDFLDSQLEAGGESLAMVPAAYFLDGQLAVESQLYACERVARSLAELELLFHTRVDHLTSSFSVTHLTGVEFHHSPLWGEKPALLISSLWLSADNRPICFEKDYVDTDVFRYKIRLGRQSL